jgi:hypothetical protein
MKAGLLSLITTGLLSLGAAYASADEQVPLKMPATPVVTVPLAASQSTVVPVRWYDYGYHGARPYWGRPYRNYYYYNGYSPYGYQTYYGPRDYYYVPGRAYRYYDSYPYTGYYLGPRRGYYY